MKQHEFIINNSRLIVKIGDVTASNAEVIVSSDDTRCTMGGGVSYAIWRHGGEAIYEDVQKKVPANLGDVVITTAGRLPQKYIFHCITLVAFGARQNQGLQEYIIERAIEKCLKLMPHVGVSSIAFPIIGAGSAAFSVTHEFVMLADLFVKNLQTTNRSYAVEIYIHERSETAQADFARLCECVDYSITNYQETRDKFTSPQYTAQTIEPQEGKLSVKKPTDDHEVFVSYSRKNKDFALLLCKEMDEMGISYWYDVDGMYSGDNFKDVLVDAIDRTKLLLFILSKDSNESPNVRKEISLAVAGNKRILPIRIDDAPYAKSIRYDLSDIDWIDYSAEEAAKAMQKFRYCLQLYLQ